MSYFFLFFFTVQLRSMKPKILYFLSKDMATTMLFLNFSYYFLQCISHQRAKVKLCLWERALMPGITLKMKILCEVPIREAESCNNTLMSYTVYLITLIWSVFEIHDLLPKTL